MVYLSPNQNQINCLLRVLCKVGVKDFACSFLQNQRIESQAMIQFGLTNLLSAKTFQAENFRSAPAYLIVKTSLAWSATFKDTS